MVWCGSIFIADALWARSQQRQRIKAHWIGGFDWIGMLILYESSSASHALFDVVYLPG